MLRSSKQRATFQYAERQQPVLSCKRCRDPSLPLAVTDAFLDCESHRSVDIRGSLTIRAFAHALLVLSTAFQQLLWKTICAAQPRIFGRSFRRKTNFRPDHVSSIAQTFTSTSPPANPSSRTTFSFKSLLIPDAFFGQEIQSMPSGLSFAAARENFFSRSCLLSTNNKIKSSD